MNQTEPQLPVIPQEKKEDVLPANLDSEMWSQPVQYSNMPSLRFARNYDPSVTDINAALIFGGTTARGSYYSSPINATLRESLPATSIPDDFTRESTNVSISSGGSRKNTSASGRRVVI